MKDEIKEILNNVDSDTRFKMVDEYGTEKEMNIAGLIEQLLNDNKHLLDYITNLQKENERLTQGVTLLTNKLIDMTKEKEDYKSRNEKAIEYIKNNTYFKDNKVKTMIFKDFSNDLLIILGDKENE